MSFGSWFVQWVNSFFGIFFAALAHNKRKSREQLYEERIRRLRQKYSSSNLYRTKKKRRRRRSGISVKDERVIRAIFKFAALSVGVLFLPLGLIDFGVKKFKTRKTNKRGKAGKVSSSTSKPKANDRRAKKEKTEQSRAKQNASRRAGNDRTNRSKENYNAEVATIISRNERESAVTHQVPNAPKVTDEAAPKSIPLEKTDQYVKKRMAVAGSYYCDRAAVEKLRCGDYLTLIAEPDNPHDRNAVAIYHDDIKIGYVSRTEALPISTSLRLGRSMYGIVTDISEAEGRKRIEYEAWKK